MVAQAYTSADNSLFIRGRAGISALDVRGFSTQLQLKEFFRLPTRTIRPPLQVFTCVLCQVSLADPSPWSPFSGPIDSWPLTFGAFGICAYCLPQVFFPGVVFSVEVFFVCFWINWNFHSFFTICPGCFFH